MVDPRYAPGDLMRGTHSNLLGERSPDGLYRVTAVRGGRVYVDHLHGAKWSDGINGWTNLWFAVGDERLEKLT